MSYFRRMPAKPKKPPVPRHESIPLKCGPCRRGDHSGKHDPVLGCMSVVAHEPRDYSCQCMEQQTIDPVEE